MGGLVVQNRWNIVKEAWKQNGIKKGHWEEISTHKDVNESSAFYNCKI